MNKVILIALAFLFSGCEAGYVEKAAFKFGLKTAMTEECEEDKHCLSLINKNFDECVNDLDYKEVKDALDQEEESKVIEYISEVDRCVFEEDI